MKDVSARRIAIVGVFVAIIAVLGFTPIGLLHVGPIYVTLLCIPVIIGTVSLGRNTGLVLGACFGLVSFIKGLTAASSLELPILQANVLYVAALCFLPRLLIPLTTAAVYGLAAKNRNGKLAVAAAALCGSLTNTFFYLGFVLLFYILIGLDHAALLALLGTIVLFAGIPEAIAAAVVSVPIVQALKKSGLDATIN